MQEVIFIGDPHAVPEELDDCERLLELVARACSEHPEAIIVFLGDQHDKHALVHLQVTAFWRRWFQRLGGRDRVYALVGNHDREVRAPAVGSPTAMEAYLDVCNVALPRIDVGVLTLLSHEPDPAVFAELARNSRPVLVCHQTFVGADGWKVMSDAMPVPSDPKLIVSGHLHAPQMFGEAPWVLYLGAPRWRRIDDAGYNRSIYWAVFDDSGSRVAGQMYNTGDVCRRIVVLEDTPEQPVDVAVLREGTDWRVNVRGDKARVAERCAALKPHAIPRPFPDRPDAPGAISERQPPDEALGRFLGQFKSTRGTPADRLGQLIREAIG